METRYEPLNSELFATADAEYPQITFNRGCLRVVFRNWQEAIITILFQEVAAYSWDDGDVAIDANHRDDSSYIVHDSPWLARHREKEKIGSSEEFQHYKLCFNAVGVLQVLATQLEVLAKPLTVPELAS